MARIVIVAQASELFEFIGHALAEKGHRVRFLHDWRDSVTRISALLPDMVIVDAGNSLGAAEDICVRIRKRYTLDRSRVLIVRPPADGISTESAIFGPDAYLERPLHPRTLLRRVDGVLAGKVIEQPTGVLIFGDVAIDPMSFQVTRAGRVIPLTLCEFRLLHYFALHPKQTCRRDHLLREVWGDVGSRPRTVDVCVRHLRMKIEEDPRRPGLIRSVRAQGYCFYPPDDSSGDAARPADEPAEICSPG